MTVIVLGVAPRDVDTLADMVVQAGGAVWTESPWAPTSPEWRDTRDVGVVLASLRRPSIPEIDGLPVTPECALALWERAVRAVLGAIRGAPAFLVSATTTQEEIGGFLRSHGMDLPGAPGPALGAMVAAGAEVMSPEQRELDARLASMSGAHDAFTTSPLPPETPTTELLVAQWNLARVEHGRLERLVSTAVGAVQGLDRSFHDVTRSDRLTYRLDAAQDVAAYRLWLDLRGPIRTQRLEALRRAVADSPQGPTISVLVPVYRPDVSLLERCVESVRSQLYPRWQLCLCDDGSADDGSADAALDRFLDGLASDSRIEIVRRGQNGGISAATNAAAERAGGEFVAFLDQDDELAPGALAEVAEAIVAHPDTDVLYTDEDKLDASGQPLEPYFKPDWCPDLLLSNMYMGHLLVVRRSLFEDLGGLRPDFDGSQDYDLALRATERARRIVHVPSVAYHWRKTEGSTAARYGAKPYADVAARAALADAMSRRGERAEILPGAHESTFRVKRTVGTEALVSIVIPYHDGADLLRKCVDSLHATAGYDNWEAVLVDNNSWQPETVALRPRLEADDRCRLLTYSEPFNWSAINNWAAERCQGEFLLFLNSDIEGKEDGWLSAMMEHAQRPEVGAVGARLLYPNGAVQHAGVVMGLGGGVAWHPFCFCPPGHGGYFGNALTIRNWTAVTGACLLVRRDVWEEVGRFDESFSTAFNDVDFCLRVRRHGYLVVYTPFAELYHYEGATRGVAAQETAETGEMFRRWEAEIRRDPYFNPNLDPMRNEFALYVGAEEVDPWENVLSAVAKLSSVSGTG